MKSYNLYFFRHGITKGNLNAQYIGHTDLPLTTDSINELHSIKAKYHYPKVDAVFSSPLKRCKDSAEIMFPDNTIITIDDFIEYNFGEFEGKTAEELQNHPVFPDWLAGKKGIEPPFGESNNEFANRIATAFIKIVDGLIETGVTHTAIVTHGGVIMALLTLFGLPQAPMHEWLTPGGCGYTIRITPSLWSQGRKVEVIAQIPEVEGEKDSFGTDDDNFNVEDYIND